VLVTRPAREAQRWVQALGDQGIAAHALPLIAVAGAPDAQALERARVQLPTFAAVMFVSVNAVDGLLQDGATAWPVSGPRAWAPGPGTRHALRAAGVPPDRIDAPAPDSPQFDSEALWQGVCGQLSPGDRVLIVRGADAQGRPAGRDWLAGRLQGAGAQVETVASYRRVLPAWGAAERALASGSARSWWLFSSSEAVANLGQLLPGHDWRGARALCTHGRIAEAAQAAGFGELAEVRPALEAVVAFLQSHP
jgi:uroporphyrinogen-III synthase